MAKHLSPLRYPGGKASIFGMCKDIITNHGYQGCQYAEPFAGGAGLALSLLFDGAVSKLHLNDLDLSIATFWQVVLNNTDELANRINDAILTVDEWHKQRAVQANKHSANPMDLAFSTFYLNRTNRSGILKAGVMGGKHQQSVHTIDSRFNKDNLIARIYAIAERRSDIFIYNLDAIDFIKQMESQDDALLMIDPPYYIKGWSLYNHFYQHSDHEQLAQALADTNLPWLLTYDNTAEISRMYMGFSQHPFSINYSVGHRGAGKELLITSNHFDIASLSC